MLSGDKLKAETLKLLKNALQNAAIEQGRQDKGLDEEQTVKVLSKEAKSRVDAAEMYQKANELERADKEKTELEIIKGYLPEQMDEAALTQLVDKHIAALGATSMADMGKVIGAVKAEAGATADGAVVARLVKEKLTS